MNDRWIEITGLLVVIVAVLTGIALEEWISTAFFDDTCTAMFIPLCIVLFDVLIIWNSVYKKWR